VGDPREPDSEDWPAPVLDVLRSCGEAAESTGAYLQLDGVGVRFGMTGDWW
jgi:hypothetical protein